MAEPVKINFTLGGSSAEGWHRYSRGKERGRVKDSALAKEVIERFLVECGYLMEAEIWTAPTRESLEERHERLKWQADPLGL